MSPIVDKIRKLLALHDGAGTQAEAEAAMAMAKRLMHEHNLSMADVAMEDTAINASDFEVGRRVPVWKKELAEVVACHFFCRVLYVRLFGCSVRFIGVGADCEVAVFVYEYALRAIDGLARTALISRDRQNDFRRGCVFGFHAKLGAVFAKEETPPAHGALVLARSAQVDAYMASLDTRPLRGLYAKPGQVSAFLDGVQQGMDLPLRVPVAESDGPAAIGAGK